MRTIVVSDLHGCSGTLERALAHARFTPEDRLVVAGDLLDGGTDDTVGSAESHGAVILAGNHEVAAALGFIISPQDESTRERADELAERFASGRWPLAMAVDGWLITHAGVSTALDDVIVRAERDPERIALTLNERFVEEFVSAMDRPDLTTLDLERYRLLGGGLGPLWFRPYESRLLPAGIRQVAGHTAIEHLGERVARDVAAAGWLLVEPGGRRGAAPGFRYAVIENGEGRLVEA